MQTVIFNDVCFGPSANVAASITDGDRLVVIDGHYATSEMAAFVETVKDGILFEIVVRISVHKKRSRSIY